LTRLFESVGLTIFLVRRVPIHGGSLRIFAARTGVDHRIDESVTALLRLENERGLGHIETYRAFASRVEGVRRDLRALLVGAKGAGKRVAGYGAAAKGMTMLSFCGLGQETLDYIADRNPLKQGRFTPGSHIPIFSPERIASDPPDYLLILAWNFADEIMAQQQAFQKKGGRFIVPVPTPRVV
jgi:hypothetical protein